MFEAKLAEGHIFKKIVEAIKDLVTDVNLDVSPSGKFIFHFLDNYLYIFKILLSTFLSTSELIRVSFCAFLDLNDYIM